MQGTGRRATTSPARHGERVAESRTVQNPARCRCTHEGCDSPHITRTRGEVGASWTVGALVGNNLDADASRGRCPTHQLTSSPTHRLQCGPSLQCSAWKNVAGSETFTRTSEYSSVCIGFPWSSIRTRVASQPWP